MKKIMFWNVKGGTGKTTACLTFAKELSKNGIKILVIDLDPQANCTTALIGEKIWDDDYVSMVELFNPKFDSTLLNKAIIKADKNISIIGSHLNIVESELMVKANPMCNQNYILRRIIENVEKEFDIIFIDCNPYPTLLTTNALLASDMIIIPTSLDDFAQMGIVTTLNQCQAVYEQFEKNIDYKVLINMVQNTKEDEMQLKNIIEQIPIQHRFQSFVKFHAKPFNNKSISVCEYRNGNTIVGLQWQKLIEEMSEVITNA